MNEDVEKRSELPTLAPRTIFNAVVSNQRSLGTCTISLSETKDIGKALDAKLNDVVMAICAGALRRYLEKRDALPPNPPLRQCPCRCVSPATPISITRSPQWYAGSRPISPTRLSRFNAIKELSKDFESAIE